MKQKPAKVGKVMREYKEGTLHSGKGGPVVKSRKQAVAIALSEAGMTKPKKMNMGGMSNGGSASSRADGIAQKGKTKGRMI